MRIARAHGRCAPPMNGRDEGTAIFRSDESSQASPYALMDELAEAWAAAAKPLDALSTRLS